MIDFISFLMANSIWALPFLLVNWGYGFWVEAAISKKLRDIAKTGMENDFSDFEMPVNPGFFLKPEYQAKMYVWRLLHEKSQFGSDFNVIAIQKNRRHLIFGFIAVISSFLCIFLALDSMRVEVDESLFQKTLDFVYPSLIAHLKNIIFYVMTFFSLIGLNELSAASLNNESDRLSEIVKLCLQKKSQATVIQKDDQISDQPRISETLEIGVTTRVFFEELHQKMVSEMTHAGRVNIQALANALPGILNKSIGEMIGKQEERISEIINQNGLMASDISDQFKSLRREMVTEIENANQTFSGISDNISQALNALNDNVASIEKDHGNADGLNEEDFEKTLCMRLTPIMDGMEILQMRLTNIDFAFSHFQQGAQLDNQTRNALNELMNQIVEKLQQTLLDISIKTQNLSNLALQPAQGFFEPEPSTNFVALIQTLDELNVKVERLFKPEHGNVSVSETSEIREILIDVKMERSLQTGMLEDMTRKISDFNSGLKDNLNENYASISILKELSLSLKTQQESLVDLYTRIAEFNQTHVKEDSLKRVEKSVTGNHETKFVVKEIQSDEHEKRPLIDLIGQSSESQTPSHDKIETQTQTSNVVPDFKEEITISPRSENDIEKASQPQQNTSEQEHTSNEERTPKPVVGRSGPTRRGPASLVSS